MANMKDPLGGKYPSPSTLMLMIPEGGDPTVELAQYGDHNLHLGYQVEPRLDRYQRRPADLATNPEHRNVMQNTGFKQPSSRDIKKMTEMGQIQPMLDNSGNEIGKIVQFSAEVEIDKQGFPKRINSDTIQPSLPVNDPLPKGANLLQDIARLANNDFHSRYLRYEMTGKDNPGTIVPRPSANDHKVVREANGPMFTRTAPGLTQPKEGWSFYAGSNWHMEGQIDALSTQDKARHYTSTTAGRRLDAEFDTAEIRKEAAQSFGAHNPVKDVFRNTRGLGAFGKVNPNDYEPVANRDQSDFDNPLRGSKGNPSIHSYNYQDMSNDKDVLPDGVNMGTPLGYEVGMAQEAQAHKQSTSFKSRLKNMWADVKRDVADLGRSMTGKPLNPSPEPMSSPAEYRDGPFGSVKTREAVDNSPQKGSPFDPEGKFSSSAPRFGEGSKMTESGKFSSSAPRFGEGSKFGDRGGFGYEAPPKASEPTNNPFTSAQNSGFSQNLETRPFKTQGGFTERNSPFGEPKKDDGPSFG